jgi:broad specificity phosphatase PhoE
MRLTVHIRIEQIFEHGLFARGELNGRMNETMNIVLIRHGEIDSNVAKVYSGRSDEPLNTTGRTQAESAAEQLVDQPVAILFTSPLRRAVETASIIGQRINLLPRLSAHFNELRMGPWEGLSEAQVESMYPDEFVLWNSRPADLCIEGRETLDELSRRAIGGLIEIRKQNGSEPVAIVSHVAVIRVLLLRAQGRPLNDYKKVAVPNATPIPVHLNLAGFEAS